jgi:DNA-3-methyladenine glycosylase
MARGLLGNVLCTRTNGTLTKGLIVETEAYSFKEKGCHAYEARKTRRNEVMFEAGGVAYVYLCYGIHEMMNVVTNVAGTPEAVLIRALEPLQGVDRMLERMKYSTAHRITSGPGKLTKSLGIDRKLNGVSLTGDQIWIEDQGIKIAKHNIIATRRIGIDYAGADADLPWRFFIRDNRWVSKR